MAVTDFVDYEHLCYDTDSDFAFALQLQEDLDAEAARQTSLTFKSETETPLYDVKAGASSSHLPQLPSIDNSNEFRKESKTKPISIIDESWELLDPNPDIRSLFIEYNKTYFWGRLDSVEVRWSPKMTLCAGMCCYEGRGGLCSIRLSQPLLKLRPRKDLVETLLHEMIHAFLFVTNNDRDHDGHGPRFCHHMNRINRLSGAKITIYHNFHDEVDSYRQHWWKCNGPCQKRPPYFGIVQRAMNRPPSPNDFWWKDHQLTCGGTYTKIKEPENFSKKSWKRKSEDDLNAISKKTKPNTRDIKDFFVNGTQAMPKSSLDSAEINGNDQVAFSSGSDIKTLADIKAIVPRKEKYLRKESTSTILKPKLHDNNNNNNNVAAEDDVLLIKHQFPINRRGVKTGWTGSVSKGVAHRNPTRRSDLSSSVLIPSISTSVRASDWSDTSRMSVKSEERLSTLSNVPAIKKPEVNAAIVKSYNGLTIIANANTPITNSCISNKKSSDNKRDPRVFSGTGYVLGTGDSNLKPICERFGKSVTKATVPSTLNSSLSIVPCNPISGGINKSCNSANESNKPFQADEDADVVITNQSFSTSSKADLSLVECPNCQKRVFESKINEHLDYCLL